MNNLEIFIAAREVAQAMKRRDIDLPWQRRVGKVAFRNKTV
jgi:alkylated DNA nucleotide flippase Atl1